MKIILEREQLESMLKGMKEAEEKDPEKTTHFEIEVSICLHSYSNA